MRSTRKTCRVQADCLGQVFNKYQAEQATKSMSGSARHQRPRKNRNSNNRNSSKTEILVILAAPVSALFLVLKNQAEISHENAVIALRHILVQYAALTQFLGAHFTWAQTYSQGTQAWHLRQITARSIQSDIVQST